MLSMVPSWTAMHPLVVHFPIALLLVTPLLIVCSVMFPTQRTAFGLSALLLMGVGTLGAAVAVATGNAAGELADRSPQVARVLENHEELAESTRMVFALLTVVFAAIVVAPLVRGRSWPSGVYAVLIGVFLVVYSGGALLLVDTAHQGGRLVHQFGMHAPVAPLPTGGVSTAGVNAGNRK